MPTTITTTTPSFITPSLPLRTSRHPGPPIPRIHRPTLRHVRPQPPQAKLPTPNKPALPKPPPSPANPPPSPPTPPSSPPPNNNFLPLFLLPILLLTLFSPAAPHIPSVLEMPSQNPSFSSLISSFIAGPHFAVSLGMGISAFIQALTGFGFAIVSVGALSQVPWIAHSTVFNAVQPVAATLGALTGWALLLPDWRRIEWKPISVLLLASTLSTPLGTVILDYFDANTVFRGLGALISGYVLYSLLGISVPKKLGGTSGAWGLGFLAGALGGAFDITGPPLVVHGEAADWNSDNGDFRRNVLTVVTINSTLVVLWDFFSGRLNDFYYVDFVTWATPTTIIGIIFGKIFADRLNPAAFKNVVLATCMLMGVKLLFT